MLNFIRISQLSPDIKRVFGWTLVVSFSVTVFSCAVPPNEFYRDGIVAWNYHSLVEQRNAPIIASIRIDDVKSEPPSIEAPALGIIKVIPVVCLIPIRNVYVNQVHERSYPVYNIWGFAEQTEPLRKNEIERILSEEIKRARIARDVILDNGQSNFTIRGSINFSYSIDGHVSGLGLFYSFLSPILPGSTDSFHCQAHFDVLSCDGLRILMSKDYEAHDKHQYFLFGTSDRRWMTYGKKILPIIIRDFIRDLDALAQQIGSGER